MVFLYFKTIQWLPSSHRIKFKMLKLTGPLLSGPNPISAFLSLECFLPQGLHNIVPSPENPSPRLCLDNSKLSGSISYYVLFSSRSDLSKILFSLIYPILSFHCLTMIDIMYLLL